MSLRILLAACAVYAASWLTTIGVSTTTWQGIVWAVVTAIVLAVINLTIKPIISTIAIPITLLTLGLFSFVINGAMIYIASQIVPGFHIPNFIEAIYFGLILGVVNWIFHLLDR
jgi:putative membrane protein